MDNEFTALLAEKQQILCSADSCNIFSKFQEAFANGWCSATEDWIKVLQPLDLKISCFCFLPCPEYGASLVVIQGDPTLYVYGSLNVPQITMERKPADIVQELDIIKTQLVKFEGSSDSLLGVLRSACFYLNKVYFQSFQNPVDGCLFSYMKACDCH